MGYAKSVIRRAEQILGYGITGVGGERTYPVIDGVVYMDLFNDSDFTINGYNGTIKKAFNGRVNGVEYFNQLFLDTRYCKKLKEITIDLDWGSQCFDTEISGLLDWLTENTGADMLDDTGISSKKIEDFSVSYRDAEEKSLDLNLILNEGFGYYIRRPFIVDVAKEQKDASGYF